MEIIEISNKLINFIIFKIFEFCLKKKLNIILINNKNRKQNREKFTIIDDNLIYVINSSFKLEKFMFIKNGFKITITSLIREIMLSVNNNLKSFNKII